MQSKCFHDIMISLITQGVREILPLHRVGLLLLTLNQTMHSVSVVLMFRYRFGQTTSSQAGLVRMPGTMKANYIQDQDNRA